MITRIENREGNWSIEVRDGHTVVYRTTIDPVLGLALSRLEVFEHQAQSTIQRNWWEARYGS